MNSREKLSEILRRCLIVAHEKGDDEFESFIFKEINGYTESVPNYRMVKGRVLAEDSHGRKLPIDFEVERHEKLFSERAVGESIASLEAIIESFDKNDTLHMTLPTGVKNALRRAIRSEGSIVFEIQQSSIVNLIEQVRLKVLQWCISASNHDDLLESLLDSEPKSGLNISSKPRIFIGSSAENLEVARNLQLELDHEAFSTIWSQSVFQLSSTALDDLISQARESDFAIFVFSDDDLLKMRGKEEITVRDNVIFEFGLFIGVLGKDRTFAVKPRGVDLHIPTDLWGITLGEYERNRPDENLQAALGAFCTIVRKKIKKMSA